MGMKLDENWEKYEHVNAHEKGGERKEKKKSDRCKGDLGEQFHLTLHIHPKRNVTSEFFIKEKGRDLTPISKPLHPQKNPKSNVKT